MHMFLASELSRIHNVSGILTADHMCRTRWHVKSTSLVPSFCKALKDRPVTQVSLIEFINGFPIFAGYSTPSSTAIVAAEFLVFSQVVRAIKTTSGASDLQIEGCAIVRNPPLLPALSSTHL